VVDKRWHRGHFESGLASLTEDVGYDSHGQPRPGCQSCHKSLHDDGLEKIS
jgi:hypothetical protein